jgi:hypothetical protein
MAMAQEDLQHDPYAAAGGEVPTRATASQASESALSLPHFIGIGAPRCGTTWVFTMLRLHPEVWIPWKELHYFDSVDPETDSGYDIESRLFRWQHGWQYVLKRLAVRSIPGAGAFARRYMPLKAIQASGYRWSAHYLLGRTSAEWYEGLFREGSARGLRCGEITPAYFMLSAAGIQRIARILPEARAFLLLRNPLQWAWSDLCKSLRRDRLDPARLSTDELIARCRVPTGHSRADFGSNVERWLENFPRERLFISYYERIRGEPVALLEEICRFIGIGPLPAQVKELTAAQVNSSAQGVPMPDAVRRHAAERYRSETQKLAALLGAPATQWLEQIESVLRSP